VNISVIFSMLMVVHVPMTFGMLVMVNISVIFSMLMVVHVPMTFGMLVMVSVFVNDNGRWLFHMDWRLFMVDNLFNMLCLHCVGEACALHKLLGLLQDNLVLSFDFLSIALLEVYSDFVVNKRKDHAVMDRD